MGLGKIKIRKIIVLNNFQHTHQLNKLSRQQSTVVQLLHLRKVSLLSAMLMMSLYATECSCYLDN